MSSLNSKFLVRDDFPDVMLGGSGYAEEKKRGSRIDWFSGDQNTHSIHGARVGGHGNCLYASFLRTANLPFLLNCRWALRSLLDRRSVFRRGKVDWVEKTLSPGGKGQATRLPLWPREIVFAPSPAFEWRSMLQKFRARSTGASAASKAERT